MRMIHTHVQTLASEADLDARGVEHDAARARDRARRQILAEIAAHDAVVAMRAGDLAPNAAELAVVDLLLRLVDVRHTLAKVEVRVRLRVHMLDLDEGGVLVLVDLAPLVAEDAALHVERGRLALGLLHHGTARGE